MTTAATFDSQESAPFVLGRDTLLHLAPDQAMRRFRLGAGAWSHMAEVAEFGDGRIMSIFEYDSSWTWWERHPVGEELVHLLFGETAFHLDGDEETVIVLRAGQSLIVPQGAWHRAEIFRPTSMLFVTPTPALTEHRDVEVGTDG
jgi:mannose-6-phosphate isomerase-like protein (cupin superfamily)